MLSSSVWNIFRISQTMADPTPSEITYEDVPGRKKVIRIALLSFNTFNTLCSVAKFGLSIYLMCYTKLYWWGLSTLLISLFAASVILLYFPLIWKSVRLDALLIVFSSLAISHLVATGMIIFQAFRTSRKYYDLGTIALTCIISIHLSILLSSFAYYWRLDHIAILSKLQF